MRAFSLLAMIALTTAQDGSWYTADREKGLTPSNVQDLGGNRIRMSVKPYEEAVRITSRQTYTGGRFSFRVKSAAVMPGIITAVYLASGDGRNGDGATGRQDEIDLEWKGNDPSHVQTNVFLAGREDLQLINVGGDSSSNDREYTIEWSANRVSFAIDNNVVRTKFLWRPLQNMQLHMAVWTTMGGWPGLIQWGGKTEWYVRNDQPAAAEFEILSFPQS